MDGSEFTDLDPAVTDGNWKNVIDKVRAPLRVQRRMTIGTVNRLLRSERW